MRGIVIAGGLGTRLRPLTLHRPKPLIPVVSAPLLEYQLNYLKSAGITEVCFATNYMADVIEERIGDGSRFGMKLVYAVENEPLDTGGAIRNAYDALAPDDCVVFNGDVLHGFDIAGIVRRHREREAQVTLTLREVKRPHPYGVVPIDECGRVVGFLEPSDEAKRAFDQGAPGSGSDTMNAGLYVLNRQILDSFPKGKCKVERDVFPQLISQGTRVFADVQEGFWIDVGRPGQYLEAVMAVVSGAVSSPKPFRKVADSAISDSACLDESAEILGNCSIGSRVKVSASARIEGSVLMDDVVVGPNCEIVGSILDEGSQIGANCTLKNAVVEAGRVLPTDTRLEDCF